MIKKIGTKKCEFCKIDFEYNSGNKRESLKRFCTGTCAKKNNGLNNKGRNHTDEWKKSMSVKNAGVNNPFYGKKHSVESITQMSKSSEWGEEKYKYCNMSDVEKEIFDGIMISDGSLSKSRISARITLGFMYMETINRIIEDLPSISFLKPWEYLTYNKKYNKHYKHFFTKTNSFNDLLSEYERWYINGKKIIPSDIKLTNLMLYWWFVCDGYNTDNNVYLCTECYTDNDLIIISEKLEKIGYRNSITSRRRIRIYKKDSIAFLCNISKDTQIQNEYLYKWKIEKKLG